MLAYQTRNVRSRRHRNLVRDWIGGSSRWNDKFRALSCCRCDSSLKCYGIICNAITYDIVPFCILWSEIRSDNWTNKGFRVRRPQVPGGVRSKIRMDHARMR